MHAQTNVRSRKARQLNGLKTRFSAAAAATAAICCSPPSLSLSLSRFPRSAFASSQSISFARASLCTFVFHFVCLFHSTAPPHLFLFFRGRPLPLRLNAGLPAAFPAQRAAAATPSGPTPLIALPVSAVQCSAVRAHCGSGEGRVCEFGTTECPPSTSSDADAATTVTGCAGTVALGLRSDRRPSRSLSHVAHGHG